jgi:hypothetical protein
MLRRMFGPEKEEITGGWGKFLIEELLNLHPSSNIIRVTKLRRIR